MSENKDILKIVEALGIKIDRKKTLVICGTLKQADILFERLINCLNDAERTDFRYVKTRREVVFKNVQSIVFTSERRFRQCYQYGFGGRTVSGAEFDKQLDKEEQRLNAWRHNRDLFFDELHKEKVEEKIVEELRECELCKKEHIVPVRYFGGYAPIPQYNTLKMLVNDSVSGKVYSCGCQYLCPTCAESIMKHIASLEVDEKKGD